MFRGMSSTITHAGDLPMFLNVINGTLLLHADDSAMLRLCMATFINACRHFKQVFATTGWVTPSAQPVIPHRILLKWVMAWRFSMLRSVMYALTCFLLISGYSVIWMLLVDWPSLILFVYVTICAAQTLNAFNLAACYERPLFSYL